VSTHNNDLKFHHSEAKISDGLNLKENLASFKISQFYENNTNEDVVVLLRNNLPIRVPKHVTGFSHGKTFNIKTAYTFNSHNTIIDTINGSTEILKNYSTQNEDLHLIKTALLNNYNNDRHTNYCCVVIERQVDLQTLKQDEVLYMPECDTLLCFRNIDLSKPHPFSENGQAISEYHKFISNRKVSGVFVELIDNENNIGNRYMYVAKQLVEIPARKDPNKKSGVYFTKAVNDKFDDIQIQPEFYDFDNSEDYLGLYRTKEEAMTGGNPDNISKVELKQLEQKLLHAKLEHDREKVIRDREVSELQRNLEISKLETLRAREEADRAKVVRADAYDQRSKIREDYYEDRSYQRKDTHELIKYLPGIALGIIGAVAYVKSQKS
jgi:hypothetical protein